MNKDGEYLGHFARTTADNIVATVESLNDDGTLMVREIGSRALHRASKDPGSHFTKGSRVLISRPSASGTVVGSGAVVLTRAPKDQRGLSDTTPVEREDSADATFILSVDPDPLVLVAGGDPGEQTIIGRGFTSAAAYSAPGDLTDPNVTDADAPTVDPAKVVMSISAAADSTLGTFDAVIGSARKRGALRVVAGRVPPYLLVTGMVTLPSTAKLAVLWVLRPDTLELLVRFEVLADASYGIVRRGSETYWITKTGSSWHARTVNPETGVMTAAPLNANAALSLNEASQLGLSVNGYRLLLASVDGAQKGLHVFAPGSDTEPGGVEWSGGREWTDVALGTGRLGFATDATSIYIAGFNGTVKINDDSFAQEAINATATGSRIIALREWSEGEYGALTGFLCVAGTGTFRWLNGSTLGIHQSYVDGASNYRGPVQVRNRAYILDLTSHQLLAAYTEQDVFGNFNVELQCELANPSGSHGSVATDGVDLFYLTTARTVKKVDVHTPVFDFLPEVVMAESNLLTSVAVADEVDLLQTLYVSG